MIRFLLLFFAVQAAFIMPSFAQDGDKGYAVVNVDRVMLTTKAAKNVEKQLKKKTEEYSKEFSSRERELREAQQKLIEENNNLGKDASEDKIKDFEKKRQDFEKKRFETQQLFQKRRGSLSDAVKTANAQIQKSMFESVAKIAEESNYSIVFDRKSVVIVEETLDITDEVIKRVNKDLPEIKLDIKG